MSQTPAHEWQLWISNATSILALTETEPSMIPHEGLRRSYDSISSCIILPPRYHLLGGDREPVLPNRPHDYRVLSTRTVTMSTP